MRILTIVWLFATIWMFTAPGVLAKDPAVALPQTSIAGPKQIGPWNLASLRRVPRATWGSKKGLVQEVYYQGEPFQGKPTRVFAYYGRPAEGNRPFPAVLLVHGGGGVAFPAWAEHWAKRGYVALAMDLAGNGPDGHKGRLADGGPDQSDVTKFRNFEDRDVREMWTYHAVADVLLGHSLLADRPEVDKDRIAVTGISWGGYLTCIIAGVDDRLKAAVPVYGCGFLHENSYWKDPNFSKMSAAQRKRWVEYFDPSRYLGGARCPMLFVAGTNDFAYPLDSYQKSYGLVPGPVTLSIQINRPHGHYWHFREVDAFIDNHLAGGKPLATVSPMKIVNGRVFDNRHFGCADREGGTRLHDRLGTVAGPEVGYRTGRSQGRADYGQGAHRAAASLLPVCHR